MLAYIIRRILGLFPVLFGVTVIVFLLIRLIPGDPAVVMLGDRASAEDVARVRELLGLNDPLHVQFAKYMGRLLRGDLGTTRNPVRPPWAASESLFSNLCDRCDDVIEQMDAAGSSGE